jgi:hypothetical protein
MRAGAGRAGSIRGGFAGTVSPNSDQPATAAVFAAPGELARAAQICAGLSGIFDACRDVG